MKLGLLGLPYRPDKTGLEYDSREQYLQAARSVQGEVFKKRLISHAKFSSIDRQQVTFGSRSSGPFDIDMYTAWWLMRANEISIEQADSEIEAYLDGDFIYTDEVLWLYGIKPSKSFIIDHQTRLVPLYEAPPSHDRDRYEFYEKISRFEIAIPTGAIVSRIALPKIVDTKNTYIWTQYKHELLARLINCLPGLFALPATQTDYMPECYPPGKFRGGTSCHVAGNLWPRKIVETDQLDVILLNDLLQGLLKLSMDWRSRIEPSLNRLANAKANNDFEQKALDLGISIEMVLLNSENSSEKVTSQLSNHFKMRGAWLIGKSVEERESYFKELGKIYNNRSKIAHNGFSQEMRDQCRKGIVLPSSLHFEIAEKIIIDIILNGPPNWSNLIMGGGR